MLKKFFKKKNSNKDSESKILIAAILVHAAKIDDKYTDEEKKVIKRALMSLYSVNEVDAEKVLLSAEIKEQGSNQIIEFTKEIKKNNIEFRLKIIEILWQIVYSDGTNDMYESNLIRRVCGLLYVPDKENGIIKQRVKNLIKKK